MTRTPKQKERWLAECRQTAREMSEGLTHHQIRQLAVQRAEAPNSQYADYRDLTNALMWEAARVQIAGTINELISAAKCPSEKKVRAAVIRGEEILARLDDLS